MTKLNKKEKRDAMQGVLILIGLLIFGGFLGSLCFSETETDTKKKPEVKTDSPPSLADQDSENWAEPDKDGKVVAIWELDWIEGTKLKNVLVYQDDKMINEWHAPDFKKPVSKEWFERPSQNHNERKFDTGSPDCETCEYVTISRSGIVKYFAWDGNLNNTVLATFMDPEAMSIGHNPQEKACTPKQLSPASVETLRLYNQLQAFKDDPEFARMGFNPSGPYYVWMRAVKKLDESGTDVLVDLNFLPGDILMLGTAYVSRNVWGDTSKSDYVGYMERQVQAGLALAECR